MHDIMRFVAIALVCCIGFQDAKAQPLSQPWWCNIWWSKTEACVRAQRELAVIQKTMEKKSKEATGEPQPLEGPEKKAAETLRRAEKKAAEAAVMLRRAEEKVREAAEMQRRADKKLKEADSKLQRAKKLAKSEKQPDLNNQGRLKSRATFNEAFETKRYFAKSQDGKKKNEIALLYASSDKAVVVVHNQYNSGEVQVCEERPQNDVSERCKQLRQALVDAKNLYRGPSVAQVRVTLIGHADIQRLRRQVAVASRDVRAECTARSLAVVSNDCIALARALDLRSFIQQKLFDDPYRAAVHTAFDPDPFMATTNRSLRGSLYKQLNLHETVPALQAALGITAGWTSMRMRADEGVQRRLRRKPSLTKKFAPFRSVVVVFEPCTRLMCESSKPFE